MWDFLTKLRLTHFWLKTGNVGLFLTLVSFKTHSLPVKNRLCGTFNQVPKHFFEVNLFEIKFEITVIFYFPFFLFLRLKYIRDKLFEILVFEVTGYSQAVAYPENFRGGYLTKNAKILTPLC